MTRLCAGFCPVVVILLLAGLLAPQLITDVGGAPAMVTSLPLSISGEASNQLFGSMFHKLTDVNSDGRMDFAVGSLSPSSGGWVDILSGFDGALIRSIGPRGSPGASFGSAIAEIGDVNGDGRPDYAVGAPGRTTGLGVLTGAVEIISGSDGQTIYTVEGSTATGSFGYSITAAGDANGDGAGDFAVGAPNAKNGSTRGAGRTGLYSGATGTPIWQRGGSFEGGRQGLSIANIGHLDGDGINDFAVGVPGASIAGKGGAGTLLLLRGSDGNILRQINGNSLGEHLGSALISIDDMDGDAHSDIAAIHHSPVGSGGGGLRLLVISVSTGATLRAIPVGAAAAALEVVLANAGDIDGDSKADVLVAAPTKIINGITSEYTARVFSINSGSLLWQSPTGAAGINVVALGDVDGSGRITVLLGDPDADPGGVTNAGTVRMFTIP